ncbi:MAG: rane protein [Bacillota bacterium]|jgi:sporulation integral membrane protein YlbJ|nr:rane protein [Bacillota bacterium]
MVGKVRRNIIPILILLIIFVFIIQPTVVSDGVFKGLKIWINNIVPYLFPMSVLSNILLQYNFMYSLLQYFSFISEKIFKSKFAVIPYSISFISGYPSGAIATNIMAENKKISVDEANKILAFANLCSFQFIAGAVSHSMLGEYSLYTYIAIPHYLGAIILSSLYKKNNQNLTSRIINHNKNNFNEVFSSSIYKSVQSILSVGSVIVIFSVFSQFIINMLNSSEVFLSFNSNIKNIIFSLIIGSLEMTNGCSIIASSTVPYEIKLVIINFLISFSGMSIIFQTIAVSTEFNLKLSTYLKSKFLLGVISSIICIIMLNTF